MRHKKLIWQIFPANLVITLAAMLAVSWYGSSALQKFYVDQLRDDLESRAYLVQHEIIDMLAGEEIGKLRRFAKQSGRESSTRITVIRADGRVAADSYEDPDTMDSHRNRPEIKEAFAGKPGTSIRFSKTLQEKMLYVAVPLHWDEAGHIHNSGDPGAVSGVLRMSVPVTAIEGTLEDIQLKIVLGTIVVVLAAALLTLLVSRRITRPLEEMKKSAERFSRGDLSQRMSILQGHSASLEIAGLAAAMDTMAEQLNDRIRTIIRQRNELETVFSSMVESVLAVDNDEKVMSLNKAAASLLGIDRRQAQGKVIQAVARNVGLQRQIEQILATRQPSEEQITLQDGKEERYLLSNGVPLHDGSGNNIGVLVVMNDVTHLRRLENIRRDFVANVSHELKTPITSIKGYVETLLDGALDSREDATRFLEIVLRQTDYLNAVIEDLLSLSRIEQEVSDGEIVLSRGHLYLVLEAARQICRMEADRKNIRISLECDADLQVNMNDTLLEQAVINLVVNGIKYSGKGSEVRIHARREEGTEAGQEVVISVADAGVGISREHLPRLFERFYRSDKARSRKLGGTGLGLAIVKHIAQAHGGDVEVESRVGEGSTFSIRLPAIP